MLLPPLYISAAHKSSGKTTISIGLSAILADKLNLQTYKKGPDYIDPIWLRQACGKPCYNLDFNTMSHHEIIRLYAQKSQHADISLIEGNKGLYDGVDIQGRDSNAALAKLLDARVILVMDTQGITRGIVPLVLGYQQFDQTINIAGIILNKTGGPRHESKLRKALDYYTNIPVLGAIPKLPEMVVDEKHLGLIPGNEYIHANSKINTIRRTIEQYIDIDKIIQITQQTDSELNIPFKSNFSFNTAPTINRTASADINIAIIQDQAFGFYYQHDLEEFARQGARLITCSAIHDKSLPKNIDGLFIGGGFPERHLQSLQANRHFMNDVKQKITAGLPCYAECGGLMYLCRQIKWQKKSGKMVGIFSADVEIMPRPQGRGLIEYCESADMPWLMAETDIPKSNSLHACYKAHEFHFSRLNNIHQDTCFAYRIQRGYGIDGKHDALIYKNLVASYAHLYHSQQNPWVRRFVNFIRYCKN